MSQPKVTFVIPAYNAAKYMSVAVDSILSQTFRDWELIIVDDCSADSTLTIAKKYAEEDSRIRVLQTDKQSGGAYIPRKIAIENAKSEIIAPLDSDDKIEPQYLETLLATMGRDDEIDICYPVMCRWDGNHLGEPYNHEAALYGKALKGRDMVKYTLDGWRIHCNGGVIRRDTYLKAFKNINENDIEVRSYIDEYLTRKLLFNARKVVICNEKYYYWENPSSITHTTDIRAFGLLWNNSLLLSAIKKDYPADSEERILMERQNFHCYFDSIGMLNRAQLNKEELRKIKRKQKECRRISDLSVLRKNVSWKYLLLFLLPYNIGSFIFSFLKPYLSSKVKK